ncbi:DUF2161 domain-containing phosphodiesterase [Actibacterium lipolyticum]|nr:DUF2161 family putative PD-(D/E)XK-type phosphodiesterase [Actibacterium lipolyticum]
MAAIKETDLYPAIKSFLEGQGYEVKSEIGAADVVALRDGEEPLIIELKTGFSLSLFHQCIARQSITDLVYLAVPRATGKRFAKSLLDNKALCRRLGLGLITVRLRDGHVEAQVDPAPYRPRPSVKRKQRLLREFARRVGDPNTGGATRSGLVTAYRQDALQCAIFLSQNGPSKGAIVARTTGVERATRLMADDHYGWFERVEKGIYSLTPAGQKALVDYQHAVPTQ